jgi:hypothetical protein
LKTIALPTLLVLLSPWMISCNRSPDAKQIVSRLPELPPQVADNLAPTGIDNVLMTKAPAPVHKPGIKPLAPKPRSCVIKYWGFVIYPLTVCSPPDFLVTTDEVKAVERQASPSGWSPLLPTARYYKLSRSSATARVGSLFCSQKGGPWYAEVTTQTSCDDSVPDHSKLDIIAGPQPFEVVWDGDLRDVPPPFDPNSFGSAHEDCNCCPQFVQCPDGRCLPRNSTCDIHPAIKDGLPK